ncbi:hypothetical protein A5740_03050 [Mycobacterium sp. GA-1841]|uniref:hypothetical protein n=1 Tax=Mycobacterium sp. GA-1841 TaxID=1834154 RepID=UPI00096DFAF7|nr:hypothetical protein [Mycobacterium sp. GA-1841]OMC39031.1 hypothetical protein A5740_03050 [Mycobacterium sp. GA-1841]
MTDITAGQRAYLLLDDHGARSKWFERDIATERLIIKTVNEARELRNLKNDLDVLDGAIVDFHLNTSQRSDYPFLRYPCTMQDCPDVARVGYAAEDVERAHREHAWHVDAGISQVDVTTGLGAMLYIKQHAPDVTLYGFCELSANHSVMFLLAARTWLGASAINAETATEDLQSALLSSVPEDSLRINTQLARAAVGFENLTDSLSFLARSAEAFDWLNIYQHCGYRATLAEFKNLLRQSYGRQTLEADIYVQIVCRWQAALHRIMAGFNLDTDGWPDLRNARSAKHWDSRNPVLDFLKSHDYQTFFTAADTRAALAYYRANQRRLMDEDPLGGF